MKSLRVQLIASILLVLGLGLGTLLIVSGSQMTIMTQQAFVSQQEVVTLAVANSLSQALGEWRQGQVAPADFQQYINAIATKLDINLSIVAPNGGLLATTHDTAISTDNSPELSNALSNSIASQIRGNTLYIAVPIVHDGRIVLGLVWADTSLAPVQNELLGRWIVLIGATVGALVLGGVAGWWLSARIVRPLAAIQVVAEQMANGRLDVRASVSGTSQELASLELAFNRMAQQVEAMLTRQTEFVANASHELRSPLAAIQIRAEALASGAVDSERGRHYAAEINDETIRLGELVTNLLQLSRAESTSFIQPTEAIDVSNELMAFVRTIRPRIVEKQQQLETTIQPDIPELYLWSNDLHVMVGNLLDNAVKYTPEGGKISLAAHWDTSYLTIEVCDTGEGIPLEDLPRVTERFFRVDRAHTRSIAGTGLGLALVLATAKQYSGSLTLDSTGIPGEGTRAMLALRPESSMLFDEKSSKVNKITG
ncbi:MAG: ATP-binding protein [Chloroflexota bacterium]